MARLGKTMVVALLALAVPSTSPRCGCRRRFDVGSSSITTTDARRRTVGFTNGYDFGYFSPAVPDGLAHHGLQ